MSASEASRSSFARGSALSFLGAAISAVMGLVLIIVLGQLLGDAGSGVVLQTIGVFTIALAVARLGMDSASVWILPRLMEDRRDMVRAATWFLVLASGIGGTIAAILLLLGAALVDAHHPGEPVAAAVRATAPFLPLASMFQTAMSSTRALGKVTAFVFVGNIPLPALRPLFVAIAAGAGAGLTAVAVAWALPLVPLIIIGVIVLALQLRRFTPTASPGFLRSDIPRRTFGYATPRIFAASVEQLLLWLAVVIIGTVAGPATAGIYGAASRFISSGFIIDTALRVVFAPTFSRLMHRGDHVQLASIYRTATIWLVLFSAPVYLLLSAFAPVALSLVGEAFTDGDLVIVLMSAGAIVTFLAGNIQSVLLMSGRSGLAALNKAIAVAVNIALIYLLVPLWGIAGAAAAWAIAFALDAVLATLELRFLLHVPVSATAGLYPLFVSVVTVGIPSVALRALMGATWIGLITATVVSLALFAIWCFMDRKRLHLDDLGALRRTS
ncbi:MAG: polysaccharide biosynthesis C-terminal domain-containing protein [Microbacterium sp.]